MKTIARIYNGFDTKFGIPRQSGLVNVKSKIIFEKEYRSPDAIRGLEGFNYIWLLWKAIESNSLTVRPPRLGGNTRIGVFATRSPMRPNPIGLSSVCLEKIVYDEKDSPYLIVSGADLLNGTEIFDIKPYLAYTDSHQDAKGGFTDEIAFKKLSVEISDNVEIEEGLKEEVLNLLSLDPRPQYHHDSERIYGLSYKGYNIKFRVDNNHLIVVGFGKV